MSPAFSADASPVDAYKALCAQRRVKSPNKSLMKELADYTTLADLTSLDLRGNYLGTKQLMAVVDLLKVCKNVTELVASGLCAYQADLGGMWYGTKEGEVPTGNEVWMHLVETVRTHPSVSALDISDNDCGPLVGRLLESMLKENENVTTVDHRNVLIDPETLNLIDAQISRNIKTNTAARRSLQEMKDAPAAAAAAVAADAKQEEKPAEEAQAEPEAEEGDGFGSFGAEAEEAGFGAEQGARKIEFSAGTNLEASTDPSKKLKMRRASKSCAPFDPNEVDKFVPTKFDKPKGVEDMLRVLLKQNLLFSHLQGHELEVVVGALFKKTYSKGDVVMSQGDEGDNMYTISKGTVDIVVDGKKVATRGEGVSFGELALMYNTPRSATVIAASNVVTWGIDQDTYRNIVMSVSIKKRLEYQDVLAQVPFLKGLKPYEILQLADALETQEWDEDDYILEYDQPGEYMYIMLQGTVNVIGRKNGQKVKVCQFHAGKHFGELEFLNNHRTVADVIATGEIVRTARLKRDHFELCLGPVKDVLLGNVNSSEYAYYRALQGDVSPRA